MLLDNSNIFSFNLDYNFDYKDYEFDVYDHTILNFPPTAKSIEKKISEGSDWQTVYYLMEYEPLERRFPNGSIQIMSLTKFVALLAELREDNEKGIDFITRDTTIITLGYSWENIIKEFSDNNFDIRIAITPKVGKYG